MDVRRHLTHGNLIQLVLDNEKVDRVQDSETFLQNVDNLVIGNNLLDFLALISLSSMSLDVLAGSDDRMKYSIRIEQSLAHPLNCSPASRGCID